MKELVFVPPLPSNIEEMKQRITAALESVTKDILQRVWHELEYHVESQATLILNIYENLS